MWCVIDAHKILSRDELRDFMGEHKDDFTLQKLAGTVKQKTRFRFVVIGWHDSTDTNIDTWGRFIVNFHSQSQAVLFQMVWG